MVLPVRNLLLISALLLGTISPVSQGATGWLGRAHQCAAHLSLMAADVPLSSEQLIRLPLHLLRMSVLFTRAALGQQIDAGNVISTDRTPLQYFDTLGLHGYDFAGKRVLDVGAGKSRFSQMINLLYGVRGTRVEGIDIQTRGPLLGWPGQVTKADAFAMPYEDGRFDLTLNSFMFYYFLPKEFKTGEEGTKQMTQIRELLAEHLRVTQNGGQIRISLHTSRTTSEKSAAFLKYLLAHDSRVDAVRFYYKTPFLTYMEIELKESSDQRPESALLHATLPSAPNQCPPVEWIWAGAPLRESTYAALAAYFRWVGLQ
jgi:ubiquinone/menaquinone biosynthesis C-methylase UbiE